MVTEKKSDLIRDLDFEVSSLCNAGCPVCMRRDKGHFTEFTQTYWRVEDVKQTIDVDLLKNLMGFNICGNFGDAMANPDIVKIIEWVRKHNPTCSINLRTNGGVGSVEDYVAMAKHNVIVSFGIDGIGEKNELYRVNVKWDKLYENLIAFTNNAEPHQTEIQFLLWSETADQLTGIIDLAKEVKCDKLFLRKPYTHGELTEAHDMRGRSTHFLTELKHPIVDLLTKKHWRYSEFDHLKDEIELSGVTASELKISNFSITPKKIKTPKKYEFQEITYNDHEKEILNRSVKQTCFSKNRNDPSDLTNDLYNIYITYDKMVMPCCMIPPEISNSINYMSGNESGFQKEILNKMESIGFDRFSLNHYTLREIVDSGVLHELVYNDLMGDKPFGLCKMHCGRCL